MEEVESTIAESTSADTNISGTASPLPQSLPHSLRILPMALVFESALAVMACLAGLLIGAPPWNLIFWRPADFAWGVAATVQMLIGLWLMRRARHGGLGRLNRLVDQQLAPLFAGCTVVQLGLIALVAGIGEELLFRGVLQPVLIGWFGVIAGVILSSAVFGLLHFITPTYAILAGAVGIYFGWLAIASGNLLGPILAHALYDFVALVYLTRRRQNESVFRQDKSV